MMVVAVVVGLFGLVQQAPLRVGQVAPPVVAETPGGNFDIEGHYQDRYVLLTFWSMKGEAGRSQFEQLRQIRRGLTTENRLLILSVCIDDQDTQRGAWMKFLDAQGKVAYGDRDRHGPFRFYEDHKWVNTLQEESHFVSSKAYGVGSGPEAFLIGPDRRLLAARIPVEKLREVVARALKKAR
jgi:hypothetical protein